MLKKALFIGINYRGSSNELRGCYQDVINLSTYIERYIGVQEVMILTDINDSYDQPTKENILIAIDWLVKDTKENDCLFMSYSGHGSQVYCKYDAYETDGEDETIVPIDYQKNGQITDCMLRYKLVDHLPVGVKLTCIFDSCHSGSILDVKYCLNKNYYVNNRPIYDTKLTVPKNKLKKVPQYYLNVEGYSESNADVVCISGCCDNQTSADSYIANQNVGACSYAFLKIITENARNSLSYVSLLEKMTQYLSSNGYTQRPQIHFSKCVNPYDPFKINVPTFYKNKAMTILMPRDDLIYSGISKPTKPSYIRSVNLFSSSKKNSNSHILEDRHGSPRGNNSEHDIIHDENYHNNNVFDFDNIHIEEDRNLNPINDIPNYDDNNNADDNKQNTSGANNFADLLHLDNKSAKSYVFILFLILLNSYMNSAPKENQIETQNNPSVSNPFLQNNFFHLNNHRCNKESADYKDDEHDHQTRVFKFPDDAPQNNTNCTTDRPIHDILNIIQDNDDISKVFNVTNFINVLLYHLFMKSC